MTDTPTKQHIPDASMNEGPQRILGGGTGGADIVMILFV